MNDELLTAAVERANARRRALFEDIPAGELAGAGEQQLRALLLGFDVDFEGVLQLAIIAATRAILAMATREEVEPTQAVAGSWFDGLLLGLTIAQVTAEQSKAS